MRLMASREPFQPKALRRNRARKAQGVVVVVVVLAALVMARGGSSDGIFHSGVGIGTGTVSRWFSMRPGVPPSGSAGCAPRPVPGRGHAASIPDACALRLPVSRLLVGWGWLAVPFILSHRSRRQGLRAPWALAAMRPSSNL
jgi:hypothetical protein